jgi:hypothetical protein
VHPLVVKGVRVLGAAMEASLTEKNKSAKQRENPMIAIKTWQVVPLKDFWFETLPKNRPKSLKLHE